MTLFLIVEVCSFSATSAIEKTKKMRFDDSISDGKDSDSELDFSESEDEDEGVSENPSDSDNPFFGSDSDSDTGKNPNFFRESCYDYPNQ